jgi:hypothetical protein
MISNNTKYPLTLKPGSNPNLCHGDWTPGGWEPPATIPPRTEAGWQSESGGIAMGTEGWAQYDVNGTVVQFYWDNPFFGATTQAEYRVGDDQHPECSGFAGLGSSGFVGSGGSAFSEPPPFQIVRTGYNNAAGAYDDTAVVLKEFIAAIPGGPFTGAAIVFGTAGIVEHPICYLTLRTKGSLRESLPLGYNPGNGIRAFKHDAGAASVRSLFQL